MSKLAELPRRIATPRQVTRVLDVTPMTLTNWRKGSSIRQPLPTIKIGRTVGIQKAELLGWLREHRPDLAETWTARL